MLIYIGKRIGTLIIILLGLSFMTFGLVYLLPSGPATILLESMGAGADPEVIAKINAEYGYDQPFLVQYVNWLLNVLQGDFGKSIQYAQPVSEVLARKLPNTVTLAVSSFILMIAIAFPFGIVSAMNHKKPLDTVIRLLSFIGISIPSFWFGMILIYLLSVQLKWLPVSGGGSFKHLIMPSITLAVSLAAMYVRRIRTAMLEQINAPYVTSETARGLKRGAIIGWHVLPNSFLTLVTYLGMSFGYLLGGTAIVETLFSWNGIGQAAVDAISGRDYHLIQGYVLWMGCIFVIVNLLVDISYRFLDPRIRLAVQKNEQ